MQNCKDRLDAQRIDWTLLRSFLAVYRGGSVAAAARELMQQQPTLSRHLIELERQLGATLFERTGRGMRATEAAAVVAQFAAQMEENANRMALMLTAQSTEMRGTVRIAASQVTASFFLPGIVADLLARYPGLELEIRASDDMPSLLNRASDIVLLWTRPRQMDVIGRQIGNTAIVACAHASYLAKFGEPASAAELEQHCLLGMDRDEVVIQGLAAAGCRLERRQFRFRSDDKSCYIHALAAGAGIGFVAENILHCLPGVRRILPDLQLPRMPYWLCTHQEIARSPLIRMVYDELGARIGAKLGQD